MYTHGVFPTDQPIGLIMYNHLYNAHIIQYLQEMLEELHVYNFSDMYILLQVK